MSAGESFGSGAGGIHSVVGYDYGTSEDMKSDSNKAPRFNRDPKEFSWWKTKMYSYIMGLDEELWDILEDGVGELALDEEGAVVDRKKHTPTQKKLYKKHHKIIGILVAALPRTEYLKMSDKSTAIEAMYSRFQTLVSGLQILNKSYVAFNHMSKILRNLPARWKPKVTATEEAKDLSTLSVEDFISYLKVHEISLDEHDYANETKSIALPSKGKSLKALKVIESEDESHDGDSNEDPAEKMAMLSSRLQYLAKKNKKFLSRRGNYKGFKKEYHKGCFNCKKPGHFIVDCLDLQKEKLKEKFKKPTFKSNKFKKQIKQSLMATWEDLDSEFGFDKEDTEDEAKVVVGLMATVTSEAEPKSDSEDENEVSSNILRE